MKKLGFIVNPVAGLGGRVGLKGTDGVVDRALELGAIPLAQNKAGRALRGLVDIKEQVKIFTCSGEMGEYLAHDMGFAVSVAYETGKGGTSQDDTVEAAKALYGEGVDMILFAGGDGTARDIFTAIGDNVVVLGIPAGVKIHSPVYAQNPERAGELTRLFLEGKAMNIQEKEVLDIDEGAYRSGKVNTRLYGYLKIPHDRRFVQNRKSGTPVNELADQRMAASDIVDNMVEDVAYVIGPGSTTRSIMEAMELPNTLLGVDVVLNGKVIIQDAIERDLLELVKQTPVKVVVTPIGGQGYLFGRGNHQISPAFLRQVDRKNLIVIATLHKLTELAGQPLLVDTGDPEVDEQLRGYVKVTSGYRQYQMYAVGG